MIRLYIVPIEFTGATTYAVTKAKAKDLSGRYIGRLFRVANSKVPPILGGFAFTQEAKAIEFEAWCKEHGVLKEH